jgi:D-alanyl-D-alanine carboxypeptidase (penicillin-binding protein 5/6)
MNAQTKKREKRGRGRIVVLVVVAFLLFSFILPLPKLKFQQSYSYKSHPQTADISWPSYGQSALGAIGYGVLDTHGIQKTAPMASITKVVTALAVMKQKPLVPGEQGGTITITAADVASYNDYAANGGSVVPVTEGEQISEYQAMQAMLLPSANNMADTLSRWAFGSTNNYIVYANKYLKSAGLNKTVVADASGFSDKSMSSAQDLTNLGINFMKNDVLREIAGQQTAEIPVAGTIHNTNWLLGTDGVVGVKTGNTDEAGGCFLVASDRNIDGQDVTVVGAILGAPDLQTAIGDSRALVNSSDSGFSKVTVAKKNQVVGVYIAPWGSIVDVKAKDDVSILSWKSRQVVGTLDVSKNNTTVEKDQVVGTVTARAWDKKSIGYLVSAGKIDKPSFGWRLYKRHV